MKKFISKEDILRCISIGGLAKEFGIALEDAASGNFNKRCTCPSKEHKSGNERTGSLFIDTMENNFYCFGCSAGSNVIDFYMICADKNFSEALADLRRRIDPKKATGTARIPTQSNFSELIKISNLFRKTMLEHPADLKWIDKLMKKTDEYIFNIPQDDINSATLLHMAIADKIKERYA